MRRPRPWDPVGTYDSLLIECYRYWTLELSSRQHTLGSCLLFLNRKARRFSDLTAAELTELGAVSKKLERTWALVAFLKPDHTNYLQLGNNLPWLHVHCIPRYRRSRKFFGRVWKDASFGHPVRWTYRPTARAILVELKTALCKKI